MFIICEHCNLLDMEEAVTEFHRTFGIPINNSPTQIDRHSFARRT